MLSLAACAAATRKGHPAAPPVRSPAERFFHRVSALCGKAFGGRIVANEPPPEGTDPFVGRDLVVHVRRCTKDRLELPFHVGDDRSRTWVVTRHPVGGLTLKHDHRHADGSGDVLTMYGGASRGPGTEGRQEFPADAETRDLFTRLDRQASLPNVWALEVDEARLVYELARPGRLFRVEFDLTREVPAPPAPWGHE